MNIFYNGTSLELDTGLSLQMFLASYGNDRAGVAASVNEVVVPRFRWGEYMLNEFDRVLVIEVAQGG